VDAGNVEKLAGNWFCVECVDDIQCGPVVVLARTSALMTWALIAENYYAWQ